MFTSVVCTQLTGQEMRKVGKQQYSISKTVFHCFRERMGRKGTEDHLEETDERLVGLLKKNSPILLFIRVLQSSFTS